ncbi:hypothetical protein GCM10010201_29130 [Pilimelia columellifera subsp. columellifera]|uniref:HTH cro/C1-type domain-containing protein n=1 Tax=Pilimelia columellifera subsp. columellifera TaxID=706583 RepID=A0ABN3NPB6_9ACTN
MTARYLADQSGMHYTRVSKLENGVLNPTEQNIREWCRICGAEDQAQDLLSILRAVDSAYVEWRTRAMEGMRRSQGPSSLPLYERTSTFRIHEPL